MTTVDFDSMTDDEVYDLLNQAHEEYERRKIITDAPARIEFIQEQVAKALGRTTGGDYRQPTGAHDAYHKGDVVTFEGTLYRAVDPIVAHSPAEYPAGWEKAGVDAPVEPAPDAPEWKPGEQLNPGDLRLFEGTVYKVLQAHTSAAHWPPNAVASLYLAQ